MEEETKISQPDLEQAPVAVEEKKPTLLIVILLIAILLIGVGGVYAGMQIGRKQLDGGLLIPQLTLIPTQIFTPTSVAVLPTNTPDATVYTEQSRSTNWKTYKNEKYGFEFKYPISWRAEEGKDSSVYSYGISLFGEKQTLSIIINLPGFGEECFKPSDKVVGSIMLNGDKIDLEPYYGQKDDEYGCENSEDAKVIVGTKKGDDHYLFMFNYKVVNEESSVKVLGQILSTFKFLE